VNYVFKPQFGDQELELMDQKGWTPDQVRRLIKDYRVAIERLDILEGTGCHHCNVYEAAMELAKEWRDRAKKPHLTIRLEYLADELESQLLDAENRVFQARQRREEKAHHE
jgi:hypothetical protein